MKRTLFWSVAWVGLIAAGYVVTTQLTAEPPVARSLDKGKQEIAIPVSRDGHYYLDGAVNGVPLRLMVDTGATYVSVGADFAKAAGLPDGITGYFKTANGTVEGKIVKDLDVQADAFHVSGLSVVVMPSQNGVGLLGQNFLRRFEVSQAAKVMRLRLPAEPAPRGR